MDIKQEHGLSYKLIESSADLVEFSPMVRFALKQYKQETGETWDTDDLMELLFRAVDDSSYFVFLVMNEHNIGVGLMTAYMVKHGPNNLPGVQLHVGYVDKDYQAQTNEIKAITFDALDTWAKERNATHIFLQTRRSPRGFDKLMGKYGFQRTITVYEKELDYGRTEEDQSGHAGPAPARIQGTESGPSVV